MSTFRIFFSSAPIFFLRPDRRFCRAGTSSRLYLHTVEMLDRVTFAISLIPIPLSSLSTINLRFSLVISLPRYLLSLAKPRIVPHRLVS
ncbi:hypothetical protein AX774_g3424 [Zancudomyces culisetae]|uniref:Uncharacterized protein n=1 Tax=Zancudomyces culisetae TaxID=1213189 RepID=A0A1R1PQ20_ZANCU|nr:hypothetical protein AX774_g3424 [Zancudomyces culisetae]|eukprot:OMH83086.1 hypothetical protein AX774_g3424 [Zancudomyces culisetae]